MRKLLEVGVILALLTLPTLSSAQYLAFDRRETSLGPYICVPFATSRDASGNFYLAGVCEDKPLTEAVTKSGAVVWRNYYLQPNLTAHSYPDAVLHDPVTGDTIVAGHTSDPFIPNDSGIYVMSITSGGSLLWAVRDLVHYSIEGLALDTAGNPIIAAGKTISSRGVFDLIKYHANAGTVMFSTEQSIGTTGNTSCVKLREDAAGHLYGLVLSSTTTYMVRYNEATGASLWTVVEGGYTGFPSLTPSDFVILPSGDPIVTGSAGTTASGPQLYESFDHLSAANGKFLLRKPLLLGKAGYYFSGGSPVRCDSVGNIYWAGALVNQSTYATSYLAGKLNSSLVSDWHVPIPAAAYGLDIVPSTAGGAFLWYELSTFAPEIASLSPTGATLWAKVSTLAHPIAFSVFDDDPSLTGAPGASGESGYSYGFQTLNGLTGSTLPGYYDNPSGIAYSNLGAPVCDNVGNTYAIQYKYFGAPSIVKFSSTGAVVWSVGVTSGGLPWAGSPLNLKWSSAGYLTVDGPYPAPGHAGSSIIGIARLDTVTGKTLWTQSFAGPSGTMATNFLSVGADDSVIVEGGAGNYPGTSVVAKFSSAGVKIWEYNAPANTNLASVTTATNGDVCLCGDAQSNGVAGYELIRLNSAGAHLGTYFQPYSDNFSSGSNAVIDANGTAYVSYFVTDGVAMDIVAVGGTKTFSGTIVSGWTDIGNIQMMLDSARGTVDLVTEIEPYNNGNYGPYSLIAARVTTAGKPLWENIYTTNKGDSYVGSALDSAGNLFILGQSGIYLNYNAKSTFVRKLSVTNGTPLYNFAYAGRYASVANPFSGLAIASDGSPVVTGGTVVTDFSSELDGLLLKVGPPSAPVFENDSYTVSSGVSTTIASAGVFDNDLYIYGAAASVVTAPAHAASFALQAGGSFTYKSVAGFKGADKFTYHAKNAVGTSNVATVTITAK